MIIFSTAFCNIGRSDFGLMARSKAKYIEQFNNFIDDGFMYSLIVYAQKNIIDEMTRSRTYPPNIIFSDISGVDTFLTESYIEKESAIMKNPVYKNKIPEFRSGALEHIYPKYTLLTHSKICFLKHTKKFCPFYTYFAWIDFGYCKKDNICGWPSCTYAPAPKNINLSLLEKKVHIGSIKLLEHYVTETEFLKTNYHTFLAFSFIIHSEIMDDFVEIYKAKLNYWQSISHADDEQNLLYQIFQDRMDLFKVFKISDPWALYKDNLNEGAESPTVFILHNK
jgi:hypothetical protein